MERKRENSSKAMCCDSMPVMDWEALYHSVVVERNAFEDKLNIAERDIDAFTRALARASDTERCLCSNNDWLKTRLSQYSSAIIDVRQMVFNDTRMSKTAKKRILSIIDRLIG